MFHDKTKLIENYSFFLLNKFNEAFALIYVKKFEH